MLRIQKKTANIFYKLENNLPSSCIPLCNTGLEISNPSLAFIQIVELVHLGLHLQSRGGLESSHAYSQINIPTKASKPTVSFRRCSRQSRTRRSRTIMRHTMAGLIEPNKSNGHFGRANCWLVDNAVGGTLFMCAPFVEWTSHTSHAHV